MHRREPNISFHQENRSHRGELIHPPPQVPTICPPVTAAPSGLVTGFPHSLTCWTLLQRLSLSPESSLFLSTRSFLQMQCFVPTWKYSCLGSTSPHLPHQVQPHFSASLLQQNSMEEVTLVLYPLYSSCPLLRPLYQALAHHSITPAVVPSDLISIDLSAVSDRGGHSILFETLFLYLASRVTRTPRLFYLIGCFLFISC